MAHGRWGKTNQRKDKYDKGSNKDRGDDSDNGYGGGYGYGYGDDRGDYHGGGSSLTKLMLQCQKVVSNTLKAGKFSESAVDKALETIDKYKVMIDAKISQWVKPDTEPLNVTVKAAAAATGDDAEANAHVEIAVLDGDGYKLCIGSAESYAATGDSHGETYVNTFSKVEGVDTGNISSFYGKGKNFEKAIECLVAIDWEDVYDKNIVFSKHHSFYSRMKKDVGDGKSIDASTDVYVQADSEASVHQAVKSMAIDDAISTVAEADVIAA
jgi:hypothetical protein